MILKSLKLTNFRNYSSLNFAFKNPITVLVGDNAQGKTNFLESIYFLAASKSNRADRDDELIRYSQTLLRVEGQIDNETKLEIALLNENSSLRKKILVNGIPRRVFDYATNLVVVFFRPEDINMVTGSPSLRRNHIDQIISQIDKDYKKTLSSYEKIIIRKNKILNAIREGLSKPDELTFWTNQQIELGNILSKKRKDYFKFINDEQKMFGNFKYHYLPSEVNIVRLKEYQEREILSANSLVGPHRDDFVFFLEEKDLSKFGSRGEQRTAILDLKFAEVEFVESVLGDRPVLLLDDIFSELDIEHRKHVIDLSHEQQTIISSVEWDEELANALKDAQILKVENGKLTPLESGGNS